MLIALAAVGSLLVAVGLFGMIRPGALQRWVATMDPNIRYGFAVGVRVVLGLLLVAAAPEARWPVAIRRTSCSPARRVCGFPPRPCVTARWP